MHKWKCEICGQTAATLSDKYTPTCTHRGTLREAARPKDMVKQ